MPALKQKLLEIVRGLRSALHSSEGEKPEARMLRQAERRLEMQRREIF